MKCILTCLQKAGDFALTMSSKHTYKLTNHTLVHRVEIETDIHRTYQQQVSVASVGRGGAICRTDETSRASIEDMHAYGSDPCLPPPPPPPPPRSSSLMKVNHYQEGMGGRGGEGVG